MKNSSWQTGTRTSLWSDCFHNQSVSLEALQLKKKKNKLKKKSQPTSNIQAALEPQLEKYVYALYSLIWLSIIN